MGVGVVSTNLGVVNVFLTIIKFNISCFLICPNLIILRQPDVVTSTHHLLRASSSDRFVDIQTQYQPMRRRLGHVYINNVFSDILLRIFNVILFFTFSHDSKSIWRATTMHHPYLSDSHYVNAETWLSPFGHHCDPENLLGQMHSYLTLPCIVNMSTRGESKTPQHVAEQVSEVGQLVVCFFFFFSGTCCPRLTWQDTKCTR